MLMKFMKGDKVQVKSGEIGTVTGEKTALDDLWVMVDIGGEIDYFKPDELKLKNVSVRGIWDEKFCRH